MLEKRRFPFFKKGRKLDKKFSFNFSISKRQKFILSVLILSIGLFFLQNLLGIHISGTNFFAGIWARHLRLYKKDDLVRLIRRTGFKIEEINELTTRVLPFNHHIVNLIARFLYDLKPSPKISDPLSKFKNVKKPLLIKVAFILVNTLDKLNDVFPGKNGLNIYIKARTSNQLLGVLASKN